MLAKVALLFTGSVMLAAGERVEPRTYLPGEVEKEAYYQSAPVSELIAVPELPTPKPKPKPADDTGISEATRNFATARIQALAKYYGVQITVPMEWGKTGEEIRVYYRSADGHFIAMHFDPDEKQVAGAHISGLRIEEDATPPEAEERFESYAADFHRRVFGFAPPAEREAAHPLRVERSTHTRQVRWSVIVNGATMIRQAYVKAELDPRDGRWTLSGSRGPSRSEVKSIEELLQKEPTRITEAEAVAIAWKHWKAVGTPPKDGTDYRIWCRLKEGAAEEREPWGGLSSFDREAKAWKNKATESGPMDPVFHEVGISLPGLFRVNALVDRIDGKVIRMNQRKMAW
ncbi:hypothetical protein OKA05_14010 [Luteolibacter arcticus]|uniref:Uncharacterized protein n=1 Tax=Luteolibacter arcticus TaxID=1581411 RepID=A0ABT3GJM9_9BACT|nr:hypothetical protein [Luteolibacter arcticus]MCW1923676.1 hypothetical protein [Luteolibacter arcticus]